MSDNMGWPRLRHAATWRALVMSTTTKSMPAPTSCCACCAAMSLAIGQSATFL